MTTSATEPASSADALPPPPEPPAPEATPRRSLVARQTLFVGFLVALTAAALTTAGYLYVGEMVTEQIDARLSAIADDRRSFLLTAMTREGDRLAMIAVRSRLRSLIDLKPPPTGGSNPPRADIQTVLDDLRDAARDIRAMRLEGRDGAVLAVSGAPEDVAALPDSSVFEGRRPAVPASATSRCAVFTADVPGRSGEPPGRLVALVDLARADAELSNPNWLGRTGEVLIGVPEGKLVRFLFPPREQPELVRFPSDQTIAMNEAIAGRSGLIQTPDRFGRETLAAFRPLGYSDWGVVVKIDAAEAYAPVRRLRRLMTSIGGTILLVGLAASYILARRLARPILRLSEAAEAVAGGRLDTPIAVTSHDEVGVLESSFSRMTEQLARSHADLEGKILARTADLEAVRDLLDAFFRISTSSAESQTLDRTFDSVLAFCSRLGFDLAMIALVDREAGVIRGVRGAGAMDAITAETVRDLDGPDILARVVREGRVVIIPDSTADPSCDPAAVARAGFRGQIVLPMAGGDEVLGTLQVAVRDALAPDSVDLRPLETLAGHAGRTLSRFQQVREVRRLNGVLDRRAAELARSEAALREQTDVLRSVLVSMSEGVVVAAPDGRPALMNPAAHRILGLPEGAGPEEFWAQAESAYPMGCREPFRHEDLPLPRAFRGESSDQVEILVGRPGIQTGRCLVVDARPLLDDSGVVRGGVAVFQEITARKRAELRLAVEYAAARVLAESESLAEAAPRLLRVMGERLEWDLAVLWRVDASAGRARCLTLWRPPGSDGDAIEEALRAGSFGPGESLAGRVWADRKAAWIADLATDSDVDGCDLCSALIVGGLRSAFGAPVTLRGECIGVLGFFSRDDRPEDSELFDMATILGAQIGQFQDRCQMHARVVQSEKLASLGMLSASVAHEINNPLAYVSSNLAVLDRDVRALLEVLACYETGLDVLAAARSDLADEVRRIDEESDLAYIKENLGKVLDSTRQGIRRVADIVHNLRGFARGDRGAAGPGSVDVQESISAALEMIRGRLDRRGIVVERRGDPVPPVAASTTQLNQVFLNLLVNAMHAIDSVHREHGRIIVETSLRKASDGDEVRVEIHDDGCGMPPDVLAQIFDPFYTTKSHGEGTGLGLSISHGIVLDQGGRIEVESVPGEGSCFRVVLPVGRRVG